MHYTMRRRSGQQFGATVIRAYQARVQLHYTVSPQQSLPAAGREARVRRNNRAKNESAAGWRDSISAAWQGWFGKQGEKPRRAAGE